MGSDSDLFVMKEAAEILNIFRISNEIKVISAHRTTDRMINYANEAKRRGVMVIIAGAGGAGTSSRNGGGYYIYPCNRCSH